MLLLGLYLQSPPMFWASSYTSVCTSIIWRSYRVPAFHTGHVRLTSPLMASYFPSRLSGPERLQAMGIHLRHQLGRRRYLHHGRWLLRLMFSYCPGLTRRVQVAIYVGCIGGSSLARDLACWRYTGPRSYGFHEDTVTAIHGVTYPFATQAGIPISKLGGISIQHPSEPSISTRNPQPISAAKDRIGTPVAYTEGMAYKCFWHPQAPAIGIAEGI